MMRFTAYLKCSCLLACCAITWSCTLAASRKYALEAEYVTNSSERTKGGAFLIQNDTFLRDGEPFQILSGSIHYQRIHPAYWKDRLQRIKALGLNAIQTYVPWNIHQPNETTITFERERNLPEFLKLAQSLDLVVLLRVGPYICAEWDFGGLPWWLLRQNPPIKRLRTADPVYMRHVTNWFDILLPRIKPLLYSEGGPIIMVQIENEYGSYGNVLANKDDKNYIIQLVSLARQHLGNEVVLYSTDGGNIASISRGSLPEYMYAVGDFGPGSNWRASFDAQRKLNRPGNSPFFCSEYYAGWLSHWGERMVKTSGKAAAITMDEMLSAGASVNLYMAHGGTNFGFWNGANDEYLPQITSYDYNAPISEAGDHNLGTGGEDKFAVLRKVLSKYNKEVPNEPLPNSKAQYRDVALEEAVTLWSALRVISSPIKSKQLDFMEKFGLGYGIIIYAANVQSPSTKEAQTTLTFLQSPRDYATAFVNKANIGSIYRASKERSLSFKWYTETKSELMIVVENLGRVNYGPGLYDPKGLAKDSIALEHSSIADISTGEGDETDEEKEDQEELPGSPLEADWTVYPINFEQETERFPQLPFRPLSRFNLDPKSPFFFKGYLRITDEEEVADTFLYLLGWGRGSVWVNGFNIGRYWNEKQTQQTLYIPKHLLKHGANEFIILELQSNPEDHFVLKFSATPIFGYSNSSDEVDDVKLYAADATSLHLQASTQNHGKNNVWANFGLQTKHSLEVKK